MSFHFSIHVSNDFEKFVTSLYSILSYLTYSFLIFRMAKEQLSESCLGALHVRDQNYQEFTPILQIILIGSTQNCNCVENVTNLIFSKSNRLYGYAMHRI